MAAGDFIPKRPHKKSRGGCYACKAKKVKCDELHPKCSSCTKRDLTCTYPDKAIRSVPPTPPDSQKQDESTRGNTPETESGVEEIDVSWDLVAAPPPLVMTSGGALTPFDLRMMHQWSTITSTSVAVGTQAHNTLQLTITGLAFDNEFLMNGILGIASLHMQTLIPDPEEARKQTAIYRAKALRGFRKALPNLTPGSREYEAGVVMSILLVVLCSRDYELEEGQLVVVNWLILYRGLSTVISMTEFQKVHDMSVGPIFRRQMTDLKIVPQVPTVLMDLVKSIPIDDPDFLYLEEYCGILDALGMLYASLQQDGLGEALFIRAVAWPSFSSHGFSRCASEYRPRALVILSYYLVFVKLCRTLWWTEGMFERDIAGIEKTVGPKWLSFMEVPSKVRFLSDSEEIVKLLLG